MFKESTHNIHPSRERTRISLVICKCDQILLLIPESFCISLSVHLSLLRLKLTNHEAFNILYIVDTTRKLTVLTKVIDADLRRNGHCLLNEC